MDAPSGARGAIAVDIELNTGGFRAAWAVRSERARQWATEHPALVTAAPEWIEQYYRPVLRLVRQARRDGLEIAHGAHR